MDDFSVWSEAGMEYEFEKRLTEDLESMQVTDLIFKAKDYVYFAIFSNEKSGSTHWIKPILPILTGDKKILIAGDIKENERYRHLLSRLAVKEFDTLTDVVVIHVDHTYEEAKELLTND